MRIYVSMCISLWISQLRGVHSMLRDQSVFLNPALFKGGEHCVCKRKAERKNKRKEKKILHVYCTLQKCVLFVRRTTKKVEI